MVRLSNHISGGNNHNSNNHSQDGTAAAGTAAAGGASAASAAGVAAAAAAADFAKWVPMRLSDEERSLLTVLEQCLNVSEYTDHVDVAASAYAGAAYRSRYSHYNGGAAAAVGGSATASALKTRRILEGILEACHIATGLAVGSGQERKFAALASRERPTAAAAAAGGGGGASSESTLSFFKKNKNRAGGKLKGIKNGKKTKKQGKKAAKKLLQQQQQQQQEQQQNGEGVAAEMTNGGGDNNNKNDAKIPPATPQLTTPPFWACRDVAENAELFQTMFEVGRRNKVLNPASMRTTYGKLMYLLQDSQNPTVAKSLGFSLHRDMVLVGPYLRNAGAGALLSDARLECAVQYVSDRDAVTGRRVDRSLVHSLVAGKAAVTAELATAYSREKLPGSVLTEDDVRRAIESLADAVAYVESNVRPVNRMLRYLEDNFDPAKPQKGYSLALRGSSSSSHKSSPSYNRYGLSAYGGFGGGSTYHNDSDHDDGGPTLTHSHSTQYTFVWQSLMLWSKVMRNMHKLWVCADDDLLSCATSYHLYNTGQGLHRVQQCPRVRKVMSSLLHKTQQAAGQSWVGLSVVHLGDRDVPNALQFIDKYTQIPRFLNPIVNFLQRLPELSESCPAVKLYVEQQFGCWQNLKLSVLQDYFKHGFDGSGDDGGSCIDGRLTSSWNWTSRLAKKPYYHAFMLAGFQGFDGDFR